MAPAHYLRATYYEHWLDGITRVLVEKGVVDAEELTAPQAFFERKPDAPATAALARAAAVAGRLRGGPR